MSDATANKRLIEQFWQDLYVRDFAKVAAYFAKDGHYTDVPAPGPGATGPAAIEARLRLGLEMLTGYIHHHKSMVADGDIVVTEHAEEWHWESGEKVVLPFVSVHEFRDGELIRWHDYWDFGTLMNAAPQWWLEHVAKGYAQDAG